MTTSNGALHLIAMALCAALDADASDKQPAQNARKLPALNAERHGTTLSVLMRSLMARSPATYWLQNVRSVNLQSQRMAPATI